MAAVMLVSEAVRRGQPWQHERAGIAVPVVAGQCTRQTVTLADLRLDPWGEGIFDPGLITAVELGQVGPVGETQVSVRLRSLCCGDGEVNDQLQCCHVGAAEICDSVDQDCDGDIDEGFGVGRLCSVGVGACAADGARVCAADGTAVCGASPGLPQAEVCNAIDDDCDGSTDEGLEAGPCEVPGEACVAEGVLRCVGGDFMCEAAGPAPVPRAEACGERDEDCDGRVDEGLGRVRYHLFRSGGGCCHGHDKISFDETLDSAAFDVAEGQRVIIDFAVAVDGHVGCLDCPDDPRCDHPEAQDHERLDVSLQDPRGINIAIPLGRTDDANGSRQTCVMDGNRWEARPPAGRWRLHVAHAGGGGGAQSVIVHDAFAEVRCD